MPNPFEALADRQIVSPRKARMRAAEKRRQKKLIERDILFDLWKKWHDKKRRELMSGPHGEAAAALIDFVEQMTEDQAADLIALARVWVDADADMRRQVLQIVDHAIIHLRERAGFAPFDDAFPGEDDTAFLIIRKMLS